MGWKGIFFYDFGVNCPSAYLADWLKQPLNLASPQGRTPSVLPDFWRFSPLGLICRRFRKGYPGSMKKDLLPSPETGQILLLIAPNEILEPLFDLVARQALLNQLYVLDGGNVFQGYSLARALRRRTPEVMTALQHVLLSRAFTCYQMAALLEEEDFTAQPVLVLDFLATFYDQGVRIADRRRLLAGCLRRLKTLSRTAPVVVWIRQRATVPQDALPLLEMVQAAVGKTWRPPRPPALPALRQAALF